MSLQSWILEFYPRRADCVPAEDAVAHSLVKWEGMREEVLTLHEVIEVDSYLIHTDNQGTDVLEISSKSCALCVHYLSAKGRCSECPITLATGRPCDTTSGRGTAPWTAWTRYSNPEPMISALKAAAEYEAQKPPERSVI